MIRSKRIQLQKTLFLINALRVKLIQIVIRIYKSVIYQKNF